LHMGAEQGGILLAKEEQLKVEPERRKCARMFMGGLRQGQ
jgi:hypothetical protein